MIFKFKEVFKLEFFFTNICFISENFQKQFSLKRKNCTLKNGIKKNM